MNLSDEELEMLQEELYQEKFRQFLIAQEIADDYILLHEDNYNLNKLGITGTINIFKGSEWCVFEIDENGKIFRLKSFSNQLEAYKNAISRRKNNIDLPNINNIFNNWNILDIIKSAKYFMLFGINFYGENNAVNIENRYIFLDKIERMLINSKKYFRLNNGEIVIEDEINEGINLTNSKMSYCILDLLESGDLVKIEYYAARYGKRIIRLFFVDSIMWDGALINLENPHCRLQIFDYKFKDSQLDPIILSIITKEKLEIGEYYLDNDYKNKLSR